MTKFCMNCNQHVTPVRHIGIGTLLIILFTVFSWLFVVPFYPKRCPMCKGMNFKEDQPAAPVPAAPVPAAVMSDEMKAKCDHQNKVIKYIIIGGFIGLLIFAAILNIVNR